MTNDAVQKQYYLDIEGEQVAVSKEVYLAYMQPVWREQKRQERQKRCIDENGRRCMKDCSQCPKTPSGGVLSLEKFMTDGLDFSSSDNVEEECVRRDLRQAICSALGALSNSDREIFLRAVAGYKEREIATFSAHVPDECKQTKARCFRISAKTARSIPLRSMRCFSFFLIDAGFCNPV